MNMSRYQMVEGLIEDMRSNERGWSTDFVISKIKREFDLKGPYSFAKTWGLLVNQSGEEFACQFMSFYNKYIGYNCY